MKDLQNLDYLVKIIEMNINFWSLLCIGFLMIGCTEQKEKLAQHGTSEVLLEVPETIVSEADVQYNHKRSLWTRNDLPFSGFVVNYYPDNTLKEKFGVLKGKKQNEAIQWFADGHFKNVTNYHEGKMHGKKKLWSADSLHVLIAHYNFHTGKAHGEQKKWYPSGELYKKMNLNRGKEEGMQQAFRKNGALYANYEAREGRIFGLKKGALCYGLEDENLLYKKQ